MKPFSFLIALFAAACSAQKSSDSHTVATPDTMSFQSDSISSNVIIEKENEFENDQKTGDELIFRIDDAVTRHATEVEVTTLYTIYAAFPKYKYTTTATYHFDSNFKLRIVEGSLTADGKGREYSYYFTDDKLICGKEENQYNGYAEKVSMHSAFAPAFGYSKRIRVADSSSISLMDEADFNSRNSHVRSQFENLLQRLREYRDSVEFEDDDVTLVIETIGFDFSEQEVYRMNREIYEGLIKD